MISKLIWMLCKEEIKTLVDLLRNMETEIKYFENLFTSFTIEQIGKEFDLIKIDMDNTCSKYWIKKWRCRCWGYLTSVGKKPLLFKTSCAGCTFIYICGIYEEIV